jgi:hypothetical protein
VSGHPAVAFLQQALDEAAADARAAEDVGVHAEEYKAAGHLMGAGSTEAVLRRVALDRQILAEHASDGDQRQPECVRCADGQEIETVECRTVVERVGVPWPCQTVLLLAQAYGWTEEQR